jgi:hypothetical protein
VTLRVHRHFETTPPSVVICWRCGRPTIYGLAEGVIARADPAPIDQTGEIRAVLAGRSTYTLRRTGLIERCASRRADPTLASPVVAAHICPRRHP